MIFNAKSYYPKGYQTVFYTFRDKKTSVFACAMGIFGPDGYGDSAFITRRRDRPDWRRRESNPHPRDATAVYSHYTTPPVTVSWTAQLSALVPSKPQYSETAEKFNPFFAQN